MKNYKTVLIVVGVIIVLFILFSFTKQSDKEKFMADCVKKAKQDNQLAGGYPQPGVDPEELILGYCKNMWNRSQTS